MPQIDSLDHLVITARNLEATIAFYRDGLGMQPLRFEAADGPRWALKFGAQKINLHKAGAEFDPKSAVPTPGSADLCFLSKTPLADWIAHFAALNILVEEGPVPRTGAQFALQSIYIRDPDENLIEISNRA